MCNSQNRPPYFNAVRLSFSQYVPRHKNNLITVEALKYALFGLYLHAPRVAAKTRKKYERLFNGFSEILRRKFNK